MQPITGGAENIESENVFYAGAKLAAGAFFDRFTAVETAAIWAAAKSTDPALAPIGVGLMQGLANGTINLASPLTQAWVAGLVAAGVLTAERAAAVLAP